MRATEIINYLQELVVEYGDLNVTMIANGAAFCNVDEVYKDEDCDELIISAEK